MGKVHERIDERLRSFIAEQQVFFVGTAPAGAEGHVNISPKGIADTFVVVAGYGECATGYIPTENAITEGDTNLGDWCWVAPAAEAAMTDALKAALRP